MILKKISFALVFSALALTQQASAATIVPVPAPVVTTVTSPEGPVSGEFQGMVTSVTQGFISINNSILQVTGDTVITYNGGLTGLAAGQIVNYSYATDVDGVKIATTIDAYPTQPTSGTARVYGLGVNNTTGGVQLYLGYGGAWATYTGPAVEYFQPYTFISGIGTNTSFGEQLVNYVGFINPTTGRILATGGYMSDIPVTFKPTLPNAVVGQVYAKQSTMELGIYGAGDVYTVTATGLPEGLVMTNGIYDQKGIISGTPTTPGTYVATLTAICGQYCVAPYTVVGQSTVTIVVTPDVVTPPTPTPVACGATGVIMNYPVSKFWLDVSIDGAAPVKVNFATQANTTFVAPATTFANGQTVSYTGTYDATGIFCNADTMLVTPAPVVVVPPADTTAPIITMTGAEVSLTTGDAYVDAGATCTDNVDTTCTVTTVSTVDTTTAGTYTVTYGATDVAGNIATPVVRTVTVNAPVVVPPSYTSTGKKVEGSNKIVTAVSSDSITVGTTVIRITTKTVIKLSYGKAIAVGNRIEYKGILNTDGSVTATSIKIQ